MTPLNSLAKPAAAIVFSAALIFGLAACGGDDGKSSKDDNATWAKRHEDDKKPDSDSGSGDEDDHQPEWAKDITTPGKKLTTIKLEDITVDVYQVDVVKANIAGNMEDPETEKPLVDEGDDIVYVNYVVTNTGDSIDLGAKMVKVEPRYDDWKYEQDMEAILDRDQFDEMDVNESGPRSSEIADPPVYPFDTDEKFSFGENFLYEKNSKVTFEATIVPVDEDGELLHDETIKGEADAKIK